MPGSITSMPPPQYTADFQKRLADFTARLGDVRLLRSEGRQDLETFARSGVDEVDYGRFQEEVRGCSWSLLQWAGCSPTMPGPASGVGIASGTRSISPQMRKPVVQTSLPGLARSLEGLQKMQVSDGEGIRSCLQAHRDILTPLYPPTEEQHGGGAPGC